MTITKKLLKRYHQGFCTKKEKRAVEKWLNDADDASFLLHSEAEKKFQTHQDFIWSKITREAPELNTSTNSSYHKKMPAIPLYRSIARYAAAISILLVTFFGGRFSTVSANATEIVDKSPKDMLYIYGDNGVSGHLQGQEFKIKFDGQLKLFNGSLAKKTIKIGKKAFLLNAYGTYYLRGSTDSPTLFDNDHLPEEAFDNNLKGDFSILQIDDEIEI
ncbi:MAG: hypothetical protein AAF620_04180 [Bacteroidota bacterium]